MNRKTTLDIDGAMIWTTLTDHSDHPTLVRGFEAAGFGDLAPEPLGNAAALKEAIGRHFKGALVQRLDDEEAFEVRDIVRGKEQNSYPLKFTARLQEQGGSLKLIVSPFDQDVANQLVGAFREARSQVPYARVSSALVAVILRLRGRTLRPQGALYWLPADRIERFQAVAETVERAGFGRSFVYVVGHRMDAAALRAVRNATVRELKERANVIKADVEGGELGTRALDRRMYELADLREEIALYEQLLGGGLDEVRAAAQDAEEAHATAGLLASV